MAFSICKCGKDQGSGIEPSGQSMGRANMAVNIRSGLSIQVKYKLGWHE